ncbi:PREDICTED: protein turtle-like [Priapulus caudatus]|uniref:Protein turtle-like n=1 Tax=Priapulus caudatus TaxID=37621 RepID=A0ABM1DQC2_PRICU|nr:PREDICTED: protein turtle-like [Priapulus caudatus]
MKLGAVLASYSYGGCSQHDAVGQTRPRRAAALRTDVSALLGGTVVLPCSVIYPHNEKADFVVQWNKQDYEQPVYISLDPYPPHIDKEYEGRLQLVDQASLNISGVKRVDEGMYICKLVWLNRPDTTGDNGTMVHLMVQGSAMARGGLFLRNTTQLRVTNNVLRIFSFDDTTKGVYECLAKSQEGEVSVTLTLLLAERAHFTRFPHNNTVTKGDKAELDCRASGLPNNVTYQWFKNGVFVMDIPSLKPRSVINEDGTLVIYPTLEEDTAAYSCRASNGIGGSPEAEAYLDIIFRARVYQTDSPQYLPKGLPGMVQCLIKSHPPVQLVTWTRNGKPVKIQDSEGVLLLRNGSLLIQNVRNRHEGTYTCIPYNKVGTEGPSGPMRVDVRDPPTFMLRPDTLYQRLKEQSVSLPCEAIGDPVPIIEWRRADGQSLPVGRSSILNGTLTIVGIQKADHGEYDCLAMNEVTTIVAAAQLMVLKTTPHAPTNVTVIPGVFSASVTWMPAFDGGHPQTYDLWYKMVANPDKDWKTIPVRPGNATSFTVYSLQADTEYEFTIRANNELGPGLFSPITIQKTKSYEEWVSGILNGYDSLGTELPTDAYGSTFIPPILVPIGPQPDKPVGLFAEVQTTEEGARGVKIEWHVPKNKSVPVVYYIVEYKDDSWPKAEPWKQLSPRLLRGQKEYFATDLKPGRTYKFRVFAFSLTSFSEPSAEAVYKVPRKPFQLGKAGIAGLVGGVSFLIVTGILALIATCVCSKKAERHKKYNEQKYDNLNSLTTMNGPSHANSSNHVPKQKKSKKGVSKKPKKADCSGLAFNSGEAKMVALHCAIRLRRARYVAGRSPTKSRQYGRRSRYAVEFAWPIASISRSTDGRFILDDSDRPLDAIFERSVSVDQLIHEGAPPSSRRRVVGDVVLHRAADAAVATDYVTSTPVEADAGDVFKISGISSILQASWDGGQVAPRSVRAPADVSYDELLGRGRGRRELTSSSSSAAASRFSADVPRRSARHVLSASSRAIADIYGQRHRCGDLGFLAHPTTTSPRVRHTPSSAEMADDSGVFICSPSEGDAVGTGVAHTGALGYRRAPARRDLNANYGFAAPVRATSPHSTLKPAGFSSRLRQVSRDGAVADDPGPLETMRYAGDSLRTGRSGPRESNADGLSLPTVTKLRPSYEGPPYRDSYATRSAAIRTRSAPQNTTVRDVYTRSHAPPSVSVSGITDTTSTGRLRTQHLTPGYHRATQQQQHHRPSPNDSKSSSGVSSGVYSHGARGPTRLSVNSNLTSAGQDSTADESHEFAPLRGVQGRRQSPSIAEDEDVGASGNSGRRDVEQSRRLSRNTDYWQRHPRLPPVRPRTYHDHVFTAAGYGDSEARCAVLKEEFRQYRSQADSLSPLS